MKPIKLTHKPIEAEAIQVASPYKDVQAFIPRSHNVKGPHGRLLHVHLVDCPDKAKPGDWILKDSAGKISVLTDEQLWEMWDDPNTH